MYSWPPALLGCNQKYLGLPGYFSRQSRLCLPHLCYRAIITLMKQTIILLNRRYPWLKIAIPVALILIATTFCLSLSASKNRTERQSQNQPVIANYTDVAPILIEGEVKEVTGAEQIN